jgi:hypothetical protein
MRLASLVTVSVGPHSVRARRLVRAANSTRLHGFAARQDVYASVTCSPQQTTMRALGAVPQESATELLLVQNGMLFAALLKGDCERCGALAVNAVRCNRVAYERSLDDH